MNYEDMLTLSGWADIIIGISGATLALAWDLLTGHTFHLGLRAIIAIIIGVVFVIKGKMQLSLVD